MSLCVCVCVKRGGSNETDIVILNFSVDAEG